MVINARLHSNGLSLVRERVHGFDLIRETEEKVTFRVSDKISFKILLWKEVLRFGHKGKLSPWFTRLIAYRLILLPELDRIHNVIYVYMLRQYRLDSSHDISLIDIET
ncbi:DNA/RNA polymerases superfamily protein [Gossypium australe]|uniref:DNA/RNA polymerases superfamily protein n=1 Tax=Gossypium australe TaxID=47621 RepID=A0A5B6WSN0_9ROSI|nr:DNA/RNA polymerases superfamily protein [Gossypium australe]